MADKRISDATPIQKVKKADLMPISDGSEEALSVTVGQIVDLANLEIDRRYDCGTPESIYGGSEHIDCGNVADE